jgi:hypothetical protein
MATQQVVLGAVAILLQVVFLRQAKQALSTLFIPPLAQVIALEETQWLLQ